MERLNDIGAEYGLEFDYSSIPELTETYGLRL